MQDTNLYFIPVHDDVSQLQHVPRFIFLLEEAATPKGPPPALEPPFYNISLGKSEPMLVFISKGERIFLNIFFCFAFNFEHGVLSQMFLKRNDSSSPLNMPGE